MLSYFYWSKARIRGMGAPIIPTGFFTISLITSRGVWLKMNAVLPSS